MFSISVSLAPIIERPVWIEASTSAGSFSLVSVDRFGVGGPVATIEATQTGRPKDVLNRGGRQAELERDVIGAPPSPLTHRDHLAAHRPRRPVR